MKCTDCGNSIPYFGSYPDAVDVCDRCLLKRYQNNPVIRKYIQKPIEEITYQEASEILDKVGMVDFPLDQSLGEGIIMTEDKNE